MQYLLLPHRRDRALAAAAFVILGAPLASTPLAAQWVNYPTAGAPRKADGKVDMSAPPPRLADGKPDFSGIWTTGEPFDRRALGLSTPKDLAPPKNPQSSNEPQGPGNPTAIVGSRQMANIGIDLPGGLPYQPWLVPIVKDRTDNLAKDDPHVRCWPDNFIRAYGMPHLLKFVHHPGLLVVLAESNAGYRRYSRMRGRCLRIRTRRCRDIRRVGGPAIRWSLTPSDCATIPGSIGAEAW